MLEPYDYEEMRLKDEDWDYLTDYFLDADRKGSDVHLVCLAQGDLDDIAAPQRDTDEFDASLGSGERFGFVSEDGRLYLMTRLFKLMSNVGNAENRY